jgi:hypothetical protein
MNYLLTSLLAKVPEAVTNAAPAMATVGFAGSPSFIMAFKGQKKSTDQIYFAGAGALDGPVPDTLTDAQPALAAIDTYLTTALILAWKVAGEQTVEVRQYLLGEGGFPVTGGSWVPLTTTVGNPANPMVQTDAAPALAIGANSQIYMAWKTPGYPGLVQWSVYNGQRWSTPMPISQVGTDQAPALAGWNTSGPGNELPLCLAWKESGLQNLYWSIFRPGDAVITENLVPGVATDAPPALTPGPALTQGPSGEQVAYYLAWKDQGAETISFAPVSGQTTGAVLTLPQAKSSHGPAIANYNTSGSGAGNSDTLVVSFAGLSKGDVWQGKWSVINSPAQAPSGGLKSNWNYFLASGTDCTTLTGVEVTITVTEPISCVSGWSFQLNCNTPMSAPNFQRCAWQQCGWEVNSTGLLQYWVNNYTLSKGDSILTPNYYATQLSSATLPKGYVLRIKLLFDKTSNNLIGTYFSATDENGTTFPRNNTNPNPVMYVDQPSITDEYLAPISTLSFAIVAYSDGGFATFTSGAGVITFKADQELTAKPSLPTCANPWHSDQTTQERGNMLYGAIPSAADRTQSQLFGLA